MIGKLIASPIIAYLIMLPVIVILGKESIGENALEEFLIIWQIVLFSIFFHFFRKKRFTNEK